MSIASEISRLNTAKANIKAAIEAKGVVVPSATTLDGYPSIITNIPTFDPYAGHDYVEIGGLKWATMNIGANSVTDYGQYFQWGDTAGYYSGSVGSNSTALKKPFSWADYSLGNGTSSPGASGMTKYNSGDTKTVLDLSDDAAQANWGGSWRMPTTAEFLALGNAVNTAWTSDYKSTGVAGMICTAKDGSGAQLFFPAAGYCGYGSVNYVGRYGYYWSSSLVSSSMQYAYNMNFYNGNVGWQRSDLSRFYGLPVRGVVG